MLSSSQICYSLELPVDRQVAIWKLRQLFYVFHSTGFQALDLIFFFFMKPII